MASFGLHPGYSSVWVWIDANKQEDGPLIVYDGPIESETQEEMKFPDPVRLYGRVWTGGPRVIIRYYSARLPDGKVIPFCAWALEGQVHEPGIPKTPGRPGSAALANSFAGAVIADKFP